ncbi:1501_t:CDS:2 [Gigaspora rosea]|nr:1501_t:CDS:2 [Gigaspora rosea]
MKKNSNIFASNRGGITGDKGALAYALNIHHTNNAQIFYFDNKDSGEKVKRDDIYKVALDPAVSKELEAHYNLNGIPLILLDTAGITKPLYDQ